jgi:hypothetical protein
MKRQLTIMLSKASPKIDIYFAMHETRFSLSAVKKNFPSLNLKLCNLSGNHVQDMVINLHDMDKEIIFDRDKYSLLTVHLGEPSYDLYYKFAVSIW